jgi:hypothetical protein
MIMNKLQERAEIYANEKMNELMVKAIAQAYIDGYQSGYNDRDSEIKESNCIGNDIVVRNLGLPSGTLWAANYLEDENGDTNFLPYAKAAKLGLPTKEQVDELIESCRWIGNYSSSGWTLYDATCIGPTGERINMVSIGYKVGYQRVDCSYGNDTIYFWIQDNEDGDEKNAVRIRSVKDGKPTVDIIKIFSGYELPVLIVRK